MISVNGQLDESLELRKLVGELHHAGKLTYAEVEPWFENVTDYGSPEGHFWGVKGHAIVGEHLALEIRGLVQ